MIEYMGENIEIFGDPQFAWWIFCPIVTAGIVLGAIAGWRKGNGKH